MICVSLMMKEVDDLLSTVRQTNGLQMVEVRLDSLALQPSDLARIFSQPAVPMIATFRPGAIAESARAQTLIAAIQAGAAYVDVEIEAASEFKNSVIKAAREHGCKVIVSYHNFEFTPLPQVLSQIIADCFASGADIAKIACMARNRRDSARLLGLLDDERTIVPIGMGEEGQITRVFGPLLGAPFTFAAISDTACTAPGQYPLEQLRNIYNLCSQLGEIKYIPPKGERPIAQRETGE